MKEVYTLHVVARLIEKKKEVEEKSFIFSWEYKKHLFLFNGKDIEEE